LADTAFCPYRAFLEGLVGAGELTTEVTEGLFERGTRVRRDQIQAGRVLVEETDRQLALAGSYFDLFYAPFRLYSGTTVSDDAGEDDVREDDGNREERREMALADGTSVLVREIQPEDAQALQRLVDRLSERSIRLRYFGPMKQLSDEQARRFAEVDGRDRCALVALDPEDEEEIVAVVRYDRERDTNRAEYAALVEDRFQGIGLGFGLTCTLIGAARESGIRDFEALVLPENKSMIRLLRSLDLPERVRREDGIKHFSIDLFPEEAAVSGGR
jgi:RimJ/RimL family protein N-acetyltransferase